jgi:hypothetical protein
MDVGCPFEVGTRINHGHIVITGKARCGDEAGEIAANNDDTSSGWGHCLQTRGLPIGRDVTPFFERWIGNQEVIAPDSGEILAAAAEAWEVMGERDTAIEFAKRALAAGYTRQQLGRNREFAELLKDPRVAD